MTERRTMILGQFTCKTRQPGQTRPGCRLEKKDVEREPLPLACLCSLVLVHKEVRRVRIKLHAYEAGLKNEGALLLFALLGITSASSGEFFLLYRYVDDEPR